jgi:hypothetical protein
MGLMRQAGNDKTPLGARIIASVMAAAFVSVTPLVGAQQMTRVPPMLVATARMDCSISGMK